MLLRQSKHIAMSITLRLHYNAVLYNVVSAWLPNIFPVYSVWKCQQTSDRDIYNASCENRTTCVFPSQVWYQLTFPKGLSTATQYIMLT